MPDIKELVKSYREIRDELAAKRKEYKAFESDSNDKMYELEQQMLKISNDLGVESFKTENGTVFKTVKTYARLSAGEHARADREAYAMETGDFGLFTAHVNKTHAKELLDEGVNLSEIGIDWVEEYTMQFRK